jgi:hypothetical protein
VRDLGQSNGLFQQRHVRQIFWSPQELLAFENALDGQNWNFNAVQRDSAAASEFNRERLDSVDSIKKIDH